MQKILDDDIASISRTASEASTSELFLRLKLQTLEGVEEWIVCPADCVGVSVTARQVEEASTSAIVTVSLGGEELDMESSWEMQGVEPGACVVWLEDAGLTFSTERCLSSYSEIESNCRLPYSQGE